MDKIDNPQIIKARNYAFLLLKFRQRSVAELTRRLKSKKYDAGVINNVINWLLEHNFIDDNIFAKNWAETRISRGVGITKIKYELKLKGVSNNIIDQTIKDLTGKYSEAEVIKGLIMKKSKQLAELEPSKRRNRLYSYLARRGFPANLIIDSITSYES
ncbi:MAG: regulatory protein RecX [Candidatus Omnitrophota bacterium]|nr:MAG: regulatory protein RecX [Candidatus Omnitrophota bacterium]